MLGFLASEVLYFYFAINKLKISFIPTHGIFDFKNRFQLTSESAEKIVINTPRSTTIFPHGTEAIVIPMDPNTVNNVFINKDADPMSLFCCSNSKLVLNGLIIATDNDIRTNDSKNNIGATVPIVITKTPLKVDIPKNSSVNTFLIHSA